MPMTAASRPLSPPRLSPSSHHAGMMGINKGASHLADEADVATKSPLVFGRPCPTLQPILALPATSVGTSGSLLSLPPFLYQFVSSPHYQPHTYQGGLVATTASALTHHRQPTVAPVCTLHQGGLASAPSFPFANPMGATYGVLVGTSSNKMSPPPQPAIEDNEASSTSSSSPSPPTVAPIPKTDAPVVSSTQPHLHGGSVRQKPISLKGSAQVLASIPLEDYTPAYVELKQFADDFKTRRICLGYTQGAVGQSLADRGYSNFAQSTISRFEQLQLSPTNATAIRQILERWLQEAESPQPSSLSDACNDGDGAGGNNCRKRKKRAVFTTQTKALLEEHFALNPRPNRATIEMLSSKLDLLPEEIRVWFCNKRQKTKQSGSGDGATPSSCSSNGHWCSNKVWSFSTSSSVGSARSRSVSPFQASCADVRGSPSPKMGFTIEELSKSSVVITPPGSNGALSPSLSTSSSLVFSPYDVSSSLAAVIGTSSQGLFSPLSFFVPKLLVGPPATQTI